jgi:hypothetical protein
MIAGVLDEHDRIGRLAAQWNGFCWLAGISRDPTQSQWIGAVVSQHL